MCIFGDGSMNRLKRLWDRKRIERNSTVFPTESMTKKIHAVFNGINLFNMDSQYRVPSEISFKRILREDVIDEIKYQSEYFDCDKFAFLFKALSALHYRINAVGIVISYTSGHAFNIVFTEEKDNLKIYKLEPQSDELWMPEKPERDNYTIKGETILL